MDERLRVALVGCGAMGSIAAREVYSADLGVELVCVIDSDRQRAAELGNDIGIPGFGSLEQAVQNVDLDAADVRTPHARHEEVALAAAAHGLHLLVEKPLATDVPAAERIIAAADEAGIVLAVAENYPHLRAVTTARAALDDGQVGDLVAIRATRVFRLEGIWVRDGWRMGNSPQAGVLLDQGTHQASLIRQLGGPIASVAAVPTAGGSANAVALTLGLRSGLVAQLLMTWISPAFGPEVEAAVYGTKGRLDVVVDYEGRAGTCRLNGDVLQPTQENYYDTHRAIVADWAHAIHAKTEPLVTGREALDDLQVVEAARASLRQSGAAVQVASST